ncbi:hypothetical protein ACYX7E_01190 [Luteimonas sp. RIT-PG2_3]
MTTRALGPAAGWSWLAKAINLGRGNPKAVIGAIALLAVIALIPSLLQVLLQQLLPVETVMVMAGVMTLVMIVVYPLLIGGVLRVIHAVERGVPTRAGAVFDTFKPSDDRARLIGFGVVMAVIYIAMFVVVVSLFGKGFMAWYMEVIQISADFSAAGDASKPPVYPPAPDGMGTMMALLMAFGLYFGGVYAIGFGQVALAGRSLKQALSDGFAGSLKNLLPIIVLAAISFFGMIALSFVLVLVGGILALIGGLIHPAVAVLLVMPLYLAMLLVVYMVMFGVMYHLWRDTCADPAQPPALPPNQVEL